MFVYLQRFKNQVQTDTLLNTYKRRHGCDIPDVNGLFAGLSAAAGQARVK